MLVYLSPLLELAYHGDKVEVLPLEDEAVAKPSVLRVTLEQAPVDNEVPVQLVTGGKARG